MGFAKQAHLDYWSSQVEAEEKAFLSGYERAQSKLRIATLCREIGGVDLEARIVALALAARPRCVEKTAVEIGFC